MLSFLRKKLIFITIVATLMYFTFFFSNVEAKYACWPDTCIWGCPSHGWSLEGCCCWGNPECLLACWYSYAWCEQPTCNNHCSGNIWYHDGIDACTDSGWVCQYETTTCSPSGCCDATCSASSGCGLRPNDANCPDNSCSQTYNDYCSGKKLVEYDNDCVQDSTTVTDWCSNTCQSDCTCTNCPVDCSPPPTTTHCCKGVCGAECSDSETQTCTKTCSYKICSGGSCVPTSVDVSGTQSCESNCIWGNCIATCPSDECSTDDDCNVQPSLTSISLSTSCVKQGDTVTVNSVASDPDGDNICLVCGKTSGSNDLCSCPSYSSSNPSCSFSAPWTDTASHTVYCRVYDGLAYSNEETASIDSDNNPPTTTIQCNGASCSSNWYNSDVKISLSYSDTGCSGYDKTYYCVDQSDSCNPNTEYTGEFWVTTEGVNYVRYKSKDNVDNWESVKSQVVKIDKTPPTGSITHSPDTDCKPSPQDSVTYTATGSDSGSGIAKIEIYVDGNWKKTCSSSPCSYTEGPYASGTHSYYAIIVDNAGNTYSVPVKSFEVRLCGYACTNGICDGSGNCYTNTGTSDCNLMLNCSVPNPPPGYTRELTGSCNRGSSGCSGTNNEPCVSYTHAQCNVHSNCCRWLPIDSGACVPKPCFQLSSQAACSQCPGCNWALGGLYKCSDSGVCHKTLCQQTSSCINIVGSWNSIEYPGQDEDHCPGVWYDGECTYRIGDTIKINISGVTATSGFTPLLECKLTEKDESGNVIKGIYFDRWISTSPSDVVFEYTVKSTDPSGNWSIDYCVLVTDFYKNYGWTLKEDTIPREFCVSTELRAG